jgi:hypothetical protein
MRAGRVKTFFGLLDLYIKYSVDDVEEEFVKKYKKRFLKFKKIIMKENKIELSKMGENVEIGEKASIQFRNIKKWANKNKKNKRKGK